MMIVRDHDLEHSRRRGFSYECRDGELTPSRTLRCLALSGGGCIVVGHPVPYDVGVAS